MTTRISLLVLIAACAGLPCFAEQAAGVGERWESTIAGFEADYRLHPVAAGGVVIYGSSSAVKWKPFQKDLGNFPMANRGFGGSTLAECARYVERAVVPCKPGVIVFYGGDNDISQKAKPEDVQASFKTMLQRLRAGVPGVKMIVLSMKPAPIRKTQYETLVQVNRLLREVCEKEEGLYFLDVWTPMMGPDNQPIAELFGEDRSHCNAKGYALWNSMVKPLLERLMAKTVNDGK